MSINFNPINYDFSINFLQLSDLEIAANNSDINTLNDILNSDEFIHFPTTTLKNSLQIAIEKNEFNIIEALLNSNRSEELISESLHLLINHKDMRLIKIIIESKVFNEILTDDLKKALHTLVLDNKLEAVKLMLNTFRFYDVQEEIPTLLETAARNENINLLSIILDCKYLEEIPKDVFRNCFHIAEDQQRIDIIKLFFDSPKTADIPGMIFDRFENPKDPMSIEIGKALINSRKFQRIDTTTLERSFLNSILGKSPFVKCLINSNRIDEISRQLLQENSDNKAVKHYLDFYRFHKNSSIKDGLTHTKMAFLEQDNDSGIEILHCEKCNNEDFFPITTIIDILHACITDDRDIILDTILNSERMIEINTNNFINLLQHALNTNKIHIVNKFIKINAEKSEGCLQQIFENAMCDNDIEKIKNILSSNLNLLLLSNIEIDESNFINLLEHALQLGQIDTLNQIIHIYPNKSEKCLKQIFENAVYSNNIQTIKNILDSNLNLPLLWILEFAIQDNNLPLIEVLISSNKISQEDLFIHICNSVNNIILDSENDLLVKIFHKLMAHNDSLNSLKLILENCEEKQLFLLKTAIKGELIGITRALLSCPLSVDSIGLFLEHDSINNDLNSLVELLSHLEFSTEELAPLLETAKITNNIHIIEAFIKCEKISQEKIVELFHNGVKNDKRKILSIISSSNYIAKEDLLRALEIALKENKKKIFIKDLVNNEKLSKDDISNFIIYLSECQDINSIKTLLFSHALTVETVKSLEEKIHDKNILSIFEQYYELYNLEPVSYENSSSNHSYFN